MDYTKLRERLLLEYIQEHGPSEEEIDAYELALIHFTNEIDSDTMRNEDIPVTKLELIKTIRQMEKVTKELDEKNEEVLRLSSQVNELLSMTPSEKSQVKKDSEVKRLREEVSKLKTKLSYHKTECQIWMSRYNVLKLRQASAE
jgi:predicted RNase H-like nuclease (RuvC/YqgF family)